MQKENWKKEKNSTCLFYFKIWRSRKKSSKGGGQQYQMLQSSLRMRNENSHLVCVNTEIISDLRLHLQQSNQNRIQTKDRREHERKLKGDFGKFDTEGKKRQPGYN